MWEQGCALLFVWRNPLDDPSVTSVIPSICVNNNVYWGEIGHYEDCEACPLAQESAAALAERASVGSSASITRRVLE